ncbi:hypothetical protein EJ06DRAFT_582689 [Trichodelitschia bisporula]|uniref:Anaphase-promoting complex subunit 1 N-terminal domain-containing protein n=1 Tax=Trichodelitschia bisporula TaxID=703511 RepID=A0A6G1HW92_9PEZI|nr:hypothetical protein EJ06DRAFT_582689 [Trichodelitschia bisporula]
MAALASLGAHVPVGVQHLVAEGILPDDPPPSSYRCQIVTRGEEDEIVSTDWHVVWSRGGVVQKVFSFEHERLRVQHVVLAWLPSEEASNAAHEDAKVIHPASNDSPERVHGPKHFAEGLAPAVVVFLQDQAHIHWLTGEMHFVNVLFDVERVFPAPRGLFIQRKRPSPPALPRQNVLPRPKGRLGDDLLNPPEKEITRLFSLTEPPSEIGRILAAVGDDSEGYQQFDADEDVMYVSPEDEIPPNEPNHDLPLTLVLTYNRSTKMLGLWHAKYVGGLPLSGQLDSQRRASFPPGSPTPVPHPLLRESFGGSLRPPRNRPADQTEEEQLASQLDPDFDARRGESRRISSLLSRADLSTSFDRSAFQNLATNRVTSFARTVSISGLSQHQSSVLSDDDITLPDEDSYPTDSGYDDDDPTSSLKTELVLHKFGQTKVMKAGDDPKGWKVFTIRSSRIPHSDSDRYQYRLFVHILLPQPYHHIQLEVSVSRESFTAAPFKMQLSDPFCPVPTLEGREDILNTVDMTQVSDGPISRLVFLRQAKGQQGLSLTLFAPWASSLAVHLPLSALPLTISGLAHPGLHGTFVMKGRNSQLHKASVKLCPVAQAVRDVIELCMLTFPGWMGEWFLTTWWNRLHARPHDQYAEWNALVITIFSLALSLELQTSRSVLTTMNKRTMPKAAPKSTPRATPKPNAAPKMKAAQSVDAANLPSASVTAWAVESGPHTQHTSPAWTTTPEWAWANEDSAPTVELAKLKEEHPHVAAAHEFISSPAAADLLHPLESVREDVRTACSRMVTVLHLLREEYKLNVASPAPTGQVIGDLAPVLAQLGRWLDWPGWGFRGYYALEIRPNTKHLFEDRALPALKGRTPVSSEPLSLYQWLYDAITRKFPTLLSNILSATLYMLPASDPVYDVYFARTTALSKFLSRGRILQQPYYEQVEFMVKCGITIRMIDTFPEALKAIMMTPIAASQANPPTTWSKELQLMVGREDLAQEGRPLVGASINSADEKMFEPDRFSVANLIFDQDKRLIEAQRMIEPMMVSKVYCFTDPNLGNAQAIDVQKAFVQLVAVRTFSMAPGKGMSYFQTRHPIVAEKLEIPGYNTTAVVKPMGITLSANKETYTEENCSWAWFHAGVAAGLEISRDAQSIDTSWISMNRPDEPTNRHAGLILALGLTGHLRKMAKWLLFRYLTSKHTMTNIGLLLGVAASHIGTMDQLVTRILSVHLTCMLPIGSASLNLAPVSQTASLMGTGLVYYNTSHRRMTEITLSEIENVNDGSGSPDLIRDECYRLAAGFAMGLINLGKGNDLKGLYDMNIAERLLAVAVGPRPVKHVHVLDRATAGATIALALTFLKTNDKVVARKVAVPEARAQFQYIRPDILLLRTVAHHLIMWDNIKADGAWIKSNMPAVFKTDIGKIRSLNSRHLPLFNILTGLLWAISLKHAGSGNQEVRDVVVKYLDAFMRICNLPIVGYDASLTFTTARNCQDLVALAAATIMAGTGDLVVMRRLRSLHGSRIKPETTYGTHLAAHMAMGVLFVGSGQYTFGTSNLAIASLLCAFYPLFPADMSDNRAHLQAFRHMWVLAAEQRCIVVREIDTNRAIHFPLRILMRDGTVKDVRAPCLIPEFSNIARISTTSREHWHITIDFDNAARLANFCQHPTLYVRRRPAVYDIFRSPFARSLAMSHDRELSTARRSPWEWVFKQGSFGGVDMDEIDFVLPKDKRGRVHNLDTRGSAADQRLILAQGVRSVDRDRLWNLRILFSWTDAQVKRGQDFFWLRRELVDDLRRVVEMRRTAALGGS